MIRKEIKIVEQKVPVYICSDGTEFFDEIKAQKYETDVVHAAKIEKAEQFRLKMLDNLLPLTNDGLVNDCNTFRWYRVESEEDFSAVNDAFGGSLDEPVTYPDVICVETVGCEVYKDDVYGYYLSQMQKTTESFWETFGQMLSFSSRTWIVTYADKDRLDSYVFHSPKAAEYFVRSAYESYMKRFDIYDPVACGYACVFEIENGVGHASITDNVDGKQYRWVSKHVGSDMRTIKITAGMTPEFEIIRTNAPDSIIEEQLKTHIRMEEQGEPILYPYGVFEQNGFFVYVIGCQDDDELVDTIKIDKEFDYYNYSAD